jgi:hypothetical protein
MKGRGRGMDKALKFFYSSPPPQPSPIKGEGIFLTFYEIIKFALPLLSRNMLWMIK